MAVLPDEDRQRIHRGLMRYWSETWEELGGVSKSELKAAVDATDEWIEDNQVSYNATLPNPFKTQATQTQKTLLFCVVAMARVSIDFLKKVFAEVD